MTAPWLINGKCEVCQKPMFERDIDYAKMKFGKVVCRQHCGDPMWVDKTDERVEVETKFLQENEVVDIPF
jgi:hypothetical protein